MLNKVQLNSNFTNLKQKCGVNVQYITTDPDVISDHVQHVHDLP